MDDWTIASRGSPLKRVGELHTTIIADGWCWPKGRLLAQLTALTSLIVGGDLAFAQAKAGVSPFAAIEAIVPGAAVELVGTGTTKQRISVTTAHECVGAVAPFDPVAAVELFSLESACCCRSSIIRRPACRESINEAVTSVFHR